MPAVSKAQATVFRIANAIRKGEMAGKPGSPSAKIAQSKMRLADIRDFARTPNAGLPKKKAH